MHKLKAPEHWSILQFMMEVMHLDFHMLKEARISSRSGSINIHTTLLTMADKKQEWTIKIRHQVIAFVNFAEEVVIEDDVPPTIPFCTWDDDDRLQPPCIDLKVPTFEAIMESPSFCRFLSILEEFYTRLTGLSPSDAKQMVTVGIADSSYATKIPLKYGNHFEQIKQIAQQLHPGNNNIAIVVPPVPLQNPSRYPAYLVQATKPKAEHVNVFIQQVNKSNSTVIAQVPCRLPFDGDTCLIRYHNAALVKRDSMIENRTADVLGLIKVNNGEAPSLFCGGHPNEANDITVPAMADFATRCEFAMNTQGWIAADEVHFLMKRTDMMHPSAPRYHGIAI